jgi:hypothetical protein
VPGKETRHDFEAHPGRRRADTGGCSRRLRQPEVDELIDRGSPDGPGRDDDELVLLLLLVDDVDDHSDRDDGHVHLQSDSLDHVSDVSEPLRRGVGRADHDPVDDPDEQQLRQRLPGRRHSHRLGEPQAG